MTKFNLFVLYVGKSMLNFSKTAKALKKIAFVGVSLLSMMNTANLYFLVRSTLV